LEDKTMSNGSIYVENSSNSKIGSKDSGRRTDSTYTSIKATCSNTCPLKNGGCYAQQSFVGMIVRRLDRLARQHSPLKIARAEAHAIDNCYGGRKIPKGRDLRIHTSGDSKTRRGTRLIANAVKRWQKRGGNKAWSYTHSWKNVKRSDWGVVQVLASIESTSQVADVRAMGYAPAIVVPEHKSDKAYTLDGSDVKWIPCVAQTRGKSCQECRLCFDTTRLYESNMGIAFSAHGTGAKKVKRFLTVIK
jgi:hypothetical protein